MGGSSVAQGGDRAPSLVQKSSESLQPQQRGNDDIISRVDIPPRKACQLRLHSLISRDWLVDVDPIYLTIISTESGFLAFFSHTANICNATAVQWGICMIGRTKKRFWAYYIRMACRASTLKMKMRNTWTATTAPNAAQMDELEPFVCRIRAPRL